MYIIVGKTLSEKYFLSFVSAFTLKFLRKIKARRISSSGFLYLLFLTELKDRHLVVFTSQLYTRDVNLFYTFSPLSCHIVFRMQTMLIVVFVRSESKNVHPILPLHIILFIIRSIEFECNLIFFLAALLIHLISALPTEFGSSYIW